MKTYWSIDGPSKAPSTHCLAFNKLDGSNLRFEWSKKRGWYKFGTRHRLFDESDPEYGRAIPIFLEKYSEPLASIFTSKNYRNVQQAIVFCEFYGEDSFAGWHNFDKPFDVTLFDVAIHKKGIVLPRDFVDDFGHLDIAKVVYEGNSIKNLFVMLWKTNIPQRAKVLLPRVLIPSKRKSSTGCGCGR